MGSSFIMITALILVLMVLVFGVSGVVKILSHSVVAFAKVFFFMGMFAIGVIVGWKITKR